jgi:carbonic anhydrase/acetyltransferase-like protein (isoleucine patch superfamily)
VAYAQGILMSKRLIFAVMFAVRIGNSYLSEQKMVAIHSWATYTSVINEVSTIAEESLIHIPREQHCLVHYTALSFLVF